MEAKTSKYLTPYFVGVRVSHSHCNASCELSCSRVCRHYYYYYYFFLIYSFGSLQGFGNMSETPLQPQVVLPTGLQRTGKVKELKSFLVSHFGQLDAYIETGENRDGRRKSKLQETRVASLVAFLGRWFDSGLPS
ncbi:hypothetical protein AA313_de0201896 [Arthrobotrys entomopaga]|nr:hypothetical protein AA313_de0201896 [Arthrobotrys entomopaga]